MSQLNIQGLISNIKARTNVYTPLIEAIANSIEAVDDSGINNGEIKVILKREIPQETMFTDDVLPDISSIEINDNGIGFNEENRNSFDTLYSGLKVQKGGKGFGRFMFLKYFENVSVKSVYKNKIGKYFRRNFDFGKNEEIIENEKHFEDSTATKIGSTLFLNKIQDKKFDKKLETIARKLVEKLLLYFIDESYVCPKIILVDNYENKEIILNDYLREHGEIQEIASNKFILKKDNKEETFQFKVFKIFYPDNQKSKISLVAHKREVTETQIQVYIPEFEENFFEINEDASKRDFMIKTYVLGTYLNDNVSLERVAFNFPKKEADLIYSFSQEQIEQEAAKRTKESFPEEIISRQEKKKKIIEEYVTNQAPWHKTYLSELNLSMVPYKLNEEIIEMVLQKAKYIKERFAKRQIGKVLKDEDGDLQEKVGALIKEITEIGKSDLAHYVCNRKIVLEFLKKLLERNDDGSAKYEKDFHDVIFPMGKDSTETNYSEHNLWVLDERLVFSQFVASDKKIAKKISPTEPDLVIFDQKRSFRNGDNEFSNPLTIFEFKRPKRIAYKQDDDPILQIGGYLEEIRAGKYETPKGMENVKVNSNTPVYGYVVCDITDKIKEFAKIHQLTISPDEEGYFGYHNGYGMYVEIISFKKLIKDADLRNRIFFQKLGI
jgi:hypothetical protein